MALMHTSFPQTGQRFHSPSGVRDEGSMSSLTGYDNLLGSNKRPPPEQTTSWEPWTMCHPS